MLQPDPVDSQADVPNSASLEVVPRPKYSWYHKLTAVTGAIFCFEIGVFLLLYPWVSDWQPNALMFPLWSRQLWHNLFFRGALSGLGVLNIWISFIEVFRFRRFSA